MSRYIWGLLLVAMFGATGVAQDSKVVKEISKSVEPEGDKVASAAVTAEQSELFASFEKTMTKVKLVGHFTIDGKDNGDLRKEEYIVEKVKKADEGDNWVITARIKYGEVDLAVPVPVEVKWAGRTPVITLDNITIPGLGTFSSRVVIDQGKYAGTWTHDNVGGHLFGKLEPATEDELNRKSNKIEAEGDKSFAPYHWNSRSAVSTAKPGPNPNMTHLPCGLWLCRACKTKKLVGEDILPKHRKTSRDVSAFSCAKLKLLSTASSILGPPG